MIITSLSNLANLLLSKAKNLTPKKHLNREEPDFATKQRMFGLLTIDEGPPLSMTAGRAVAQLLLVWAHLALTALKIKEG